MTWQLRLDDLARSSSPRTDDVTDELLARQCTRCGAVGTHYLTCPGLRLPPGYRLIDDREPERVRSLPADHHAGHRAEPYLTDPIGPVFQPEPGKRRGGPDHPDWPVPPRH